MRERERDIKKSNELDRDSDRKTDSSNYLTIFVKKISFQDTGHVIDHRLTAL